MPIVDDKKGQSQLQKAKRIPRSFLHKNTDASNFHKNLYFSRLVPHTLKVLFYEDFIIYFGSKTAKIISAC